MEKEEYLLSSFNNVQSLIQFADQKVASILLVDSITIGIFVSQAKEFSFSINNLSFWNIVTFISGLIFVILNILILYKGIMKVLRPAFAKHYSSNDFSLFYFGHIASHNKTEVFEESKKINDKRITKELSDQLFEISKILNRKNREINKIAVYLFFSILSFVVFLFSSTFA